MDVKRRKKLKIVAWIGLGIGLSWLAFNVLMVLGEMGGTPGSRPADPLDDWLQVYLPTILIGVSLLLFISAYWKRKEP